LNSSPNILIVDDEEPVRNLLVACLSSNYTCHAAAGAEDAIRALETSPFDLVITDITMSGMSGIDLCNWIAQKYLHLPVVFMSGDLPDGYDEKVKACGPFGFIPKPFDLSKVMEIVDRAINQRLDRVSSSCVGKPPV